MKYLLNNRNGNKFTGLDKHIRCKCGKQWGLEKFRSQTNCKRCKTPVIARGELGRNNLNASL